MCKIHQKQLQVYTIYSKTIPPSTIMGVGITSQVCPIIYIFFQNLLAWNKFEHPNNVGGTTYFQERKKNKVHWALIVPLIAKFMIYKIKNYSATQKVAIQKSFKELRADSSPLKALLFLLLSSKTQNLTEQFTLYLFFPVQRNQTLTDHVVPNHLNLKELNGKERYQIP